MKKDARYLRWALFGFYLLMLGWIILFKMEFSLSSLDRYRAVNWIPFAESTYLDGRWNRSEIIGNILAFIPLGLYLSMLVGQWPLWKRLACVFAVSLTFEILQYALAVGVSDVTDLIGNTLGGAAGLAAYAAVLRIMRDRARTNRLFTILALIGSACCAGLISLLLLVN